MTVRLDSHLAMRAFVDELVRCGMRQAATSPGSRSTPLLLALARDRRLVASSHLDERCGAFFALGAAKASGRPVALSCTSGTAAANWAPAVIEAYEARVPLLVLTADRPPELRDVGAGQTIDQLKLFGRAAKWFVDVDDAPATPERMRWIRSLACRAYWTSLHGRPGPVHLNFAFREPLVPGGPLTADHGEPGDGPRAGGRPWLTAPAAAAAPEPGLFKAVEEELYTRSRSVIVAGREERRPELAGLLAQLAERMRMPLLADPLSGARRGTAAIAHYDALLRDGDWAAAHAPELVLRFGDLPTSKPLRQWLAAAPDALQIAFDPEGAGQDPAGVVATVIDGDPEAWARTLVKRGPRRRHGEDWLADWHAADRGASAAIATTLGAAAGLSEPRVAAELGALLPAGATLVVSSSMPVRDVETFFPVRAQPFRVLANRGANGIDGQVSTAFGVAAASSGPVVLLCGDVALLHDLGGLVAARRLDGLRLTIVCLDNDGGGIFHFLPVAGEGEPFEQHVATPHGVDFTHAAALAGFDFASPDTPDAFRDALSGALAGDRSTLIVVRTDREENVTLHRAVWEAVRPAR